MNPPPNTGTSVVDDEPTDARERALATAERMRKLTALEERVDDIDERLIAIESALAARRVPPDVALLNRMREEREDRSQR